jgi:hypothetical protein
MTRFHQPGSQPVDIPETIPNPAAPEQPARTPAPATVPKPARIPEPAPADALARRYDPPVRSPFRR